MKYVLNICFLAGLSLNLGFGQPQPSYRGNGRINNPIITAVPFLTISPDSRAGAMGDVGVASSPDVNSQHWNIAKYAFMKQGGGFSINYSPWLKNLVNDINLYYVVGYFNINERHAISSSLRYFTMGNITFTDDFGGYNGDFEPKEFAFDVAYSLKLTDNLSGGIGFRFINSNLTGGFSDVNGEEVKGRTGAADLGFYYVNQTEVSKRDAEYALGINFSNMGAKIGYSPDYKEFLPINLRIGGRFTMDVDAYNKVSLLLDLNKLMVPTPIEVDTAGLTADAVQQILREQQDVSVPVGMFQSFSDAPGGFEEELSEITYSAGLEYLYREQFAIRGGYFHENTYKGNRKFFTVGVGLKYNVFGFDFSYLVPTSGKNSPLANTVRFSLLFDFSR